MPTPSVNALGDPRIDQSEARYRNAAAALTGSDRRQRATLVVAAFMAGGAALSSGGLLWRAGLAVAIAVMVWFSVGSYRFGCASVEAQHETTFLIFQHAEPHLGSVEVLAAIAREQRAARISMITVRAAVEVTVYPLMLVAVSLVGNQDAELWLVYAAIGSIAVLLLSVYYLRVLLLRLVGLHARYQAKLAAMHDECPPSC